MKFIKIKYYLNRISKERFTQLSQELGLIFATENKTADKIAQIFYYPYTRSTKTRKGVNAGGALYDKYLNYRQQLISSDLINNNDCSQESLF